MITDIVIADMPDIYRRLVDLYPDKPWVSHTDNQKRDAGSNHLLLYSMRRDNPIAFALADYDAGGEAMLRRDDVRVALAVSAQVLDLVVRVEDDRLARRFEAAMKEPGEMRGLRLELMMAHMMWRQGAGIEWSEECKEGADRFDFLATIPDLGEVEVECKSWSEEKGVDVSLDQASRFLIPVIQAVVPGCFEGLDQGRLLEIRLVMPDKLPTDHRITAEATKALCLAIGQREACVPGLGDLTYQVHEAPYLLRGEGYELDVQGNILTRHLKSLVPDWAGQTIPVFRDGKALAIRIQTSKPHTTFALMKESAKKAIRRQMTGRKPGCLVVQADGYTHHQVAHMARDAKSLASVFGKEMFQSAQHQHLACIIWLSAAEVGHLGGGRYTELSTAYTMETKSGPYAELGIAGFLNKALTHG